MVDGCGNDPPLARLRCHLATGLRDEAGLEKSSLVIKRG